MPVVRKYVGQSFFTHRLHRNAIWQTISLVRPCAVEFEAREKRFMGLWNYSHRRIFQNGLNIGGGFAAHIFRPTLDRKSTRLNSSHRCISYAVFCLKKKNKRV